MVDIPVQWIFNLYLMLEDKGQVNAVLVVYLPGIFGNFY